LPAQLERGIDRGGRVTRQVPPRPHARDAVAERRFELGRAGRLERAVQELRELRVGAGFVRHTP
jgi:hypothetical protein